MRAVIHAARVARATGICVVAFGALFIAGAASAATIIIKNTDSAGEGFNDTTAWTPTGGNPATTLGQARLNVFNRAATMWGRRIISSVTIHVDASFDPLDCSADSGTLGQAGSNYFYPLTSGSTILYPKALASKLRGSEVNSTHADITAQFNSNVNNNGSCLGGENFYYGYDHNLGNNDIADLLGVVLHELGHGLGFISVVGSDGSGIDYKTSSGSTVHALSIFDQFIYDESTSTFWKNMSNAQRASSALNNQFVVWNDANSGGRVDNSTYLSAGKSTAGHVKLYAPTTWNGGSSISHWDTTATPNLLMEPRYHADTPNHTDLTTCVMYDLGWGGSHCPDYANSAPIATALAISTTMNTAAAVTLAATDSDGDALTYSIVTSPAHGAVSGTGAARTYTPATGYTGADSFSYKANDGLDDSAAATVSVTVDAVSSSSSSSSSSGGSSSSSSSSGGSSSVGSSSGGSHSGGGGSFGGALLAVLGLASLLTVWRRQRGGERQAGRLRAGKFIEVI